MEKIITSFTDMFIKYCNEWNTNWVNGDYQINALPSVNPSFDIEQNLYDSKGTKINDKIISPSLFIDLAISLFKELNKTGNKTLNSIKFIFTNRILSKSELSSNLEIINDFEKNLPKSKKGKMKGWYLPDENVEKEAEILKQLPKSFVKFDTTNLDYEKAFNELNKTVTYPEDPLWDGGFYAIRKQENTWTGESCLYLFDAEEENPRNFQAEKVDFDLNITDEMKVLFNFIQQFYAEYNPNEPYDAMFVTVQPNQSYVVNYEYGGEEVFPNAPPKPDEINADYILQNLYNCLVYNTPENFEWAWAIISRGKNSEGHPVKSGSYFYSLQPDKSNPQKLIPGEYEFMINVTIRLFEEFIEKENHNWTKVQILFSKNNEKNYCQILE